VDNSSDKGNDDGDVPTIEEILHTTLQKEGFAKARARIIGRGGGEVALDEISAPTDHSKSAPVGNSGGSHRERVH
jgi:hypothetical protein